MSRADSLYGAGHHDALFKGNPITMVPFPQAGRRKDRHLYDQEKVRSLLKSKPDLQDVDPRTLSATQPHVTRAGVQHYMKGADGTYKDQGNAGNAHPVVYKRDDGTNILLSGHHRAVAALLEGRPLKARVTSGSWPEKSA